MIKDELSKILYPEIQPNHSGRLQVSDLHEIYYEESGNPEGRPVVFLHGGPGGGTSPMHRRFFDPRKYRIILFDQRGCGKSTPHAEMKENTTWDLVSDIEKLRTTLGIKKWQVFGGSWGSFLALAYAIKHPDKVSELVLRGIFLLRKKELDWFYQQGASEIFPDAFKNYASVIEEDQRHDLMTAFHKQLNSGSKESQIIAARAWSKWEASTWRLIPEQSEIDHAEDADFAIAFARTENHYFVNKGFLSHENELLDGVEKIRKIPAVIVHGRYDVVCPVSNAFDLKERWPEADFQVLPDCGHSAFEPGIAKALVEATNKFA